MTARSLVLVTHYFSTHCGGVESVAENLACHISMEHGWKVIWMASDTGPLPDSLPGRVRLVPARSWNVVERRLGIPWPIWSPSALRKLWKVVGAADVVHLHDALYFGNLFAWLFARLRGVPVIVTQHIGSVPFKSVLLRGLHALANHTLGRLVLSNADRVVFVSPAVRREFERFCRFRNAPVYVPNGVDLKVFNPVGPVADDLAITQARNAGRRAFLFVGRFVEKKGLNILRDLAAALPDDLWLFAGQGPLDPSAWGLPNVLVVRGSSGADLARYYRAADLLVLPSVGEGFPLVVQEAMACGTPALVGEETAQGCPAARPLLFVEGVGDDAAARWAETVVRIAADPHGLRKRRAEVAGFARANWSWEAAAAEYAGIIDGLLQSRRGTRRGTAGV